MTVPLDEPATDWAGQTYAERLFLCADRSAGFHNPNKTTCPVCRKRVKKVGLADHMRDAHRAVPPARSRSDLAGAAWGERGKP